MPNTLDSGSATWIAVIIIILVILGIVFVRGLLNRVVEFLLLLLANRTGRIVLGSFLLAGGLIFALTSHFASYDQIADADLAYLQPVNSADIGKAYIMDAAHPGTFYVIHEADFSPPVHAYMLRVNGGFKSLIYNKNDSEAVGIDDVPTGTAYTVEEFSIVDYLGMNRYTFASAKYRENPEGAYQNNWPIGGGIAVVGLILLVVTFGISRVIEQSGRTTPSWATPSTQSPYATSPVSVEAPPYAPSPIPAEAPPLDSPVVTTLQNPDTDQNVQPSEVPQAPEEQKSGEIE